MNRLRILSLGLGMLCAPVILAAHGVDAGRLGQMKAVLELCSASAPQAASQYLLQMKALIGDATRAEVERAVRSDEYQQSYQAIQSEFSGLTLEGRTTACASYLAAVP